VEEGTQPLLGSVQLEVIGALAVVHCVPAAGTLAARLTGVFPVVPAAAAHPPDAGGRGLAAAVVPAEDHAARVADQLFLAEQALDSRIVQSLPKVPVAPRPILGPEVVVADWHGLILLRRTNLARIAGEPGRRLPLQK